MLIVFGLCALHLPSKIHSDDLSRETEGASEYSIKIARKDGITWVHESRWYAYDSTLHSDLIDEQYARAPINPFVLAVSISMKCK